MRNIRAISSAERQRADVVRAIKLIKRRTVPRGNLVRIDDSVGLIVSAETSRRIGNISEVDEMCINSCLRPLIERVEDGKVAWTGIARDSENRRQSRNGRVRTHADGAGGHGLLKTRIVQQQAIKRIGISAKDDACYIA